MPGQFKYSRASNQFFSQGPNGRWQTVPDTQVPPMVRLNILKKYQPGRPQGSIMANVGNNPPMQAPPVSAIKKAYADLPLAPHTPTQAAIDAAMVGGAIALPEVEGAGLLARLPGALGRTGITAGTGAVANKVQGLDPYAGAKSGAIQQAFGEATGPLLTGALNSAGRLSDKSVNKIDTAKLGTFLRKLGDWMPMPKNVGAFDLAFRNKEAREQVGTKLRSLESQIGGVLGDRKIMTMKTPSYIGGREFGSGLEVPATFPQVIKRIEELNEQAKWERSPMDPALKIQGRQARIEARELRDKLEKSLNAQDSQGRLGTDYMQSRRQYAGVNTLTDLFSTKDLYKDDGTVDWSKLQELVANSAENNGFRDDLNRIFGREKTQELVSNIYRGAPATARDVPGEGLMAIPRVVLHGKSLGAYGHLPKGGVFTKYVGKVPRRFPVVNVPAAVPGILGGQAAEEVVE